MIYFYKLTNINDNTLECYLGSTTNIHKRTRDHKSDCNNPHSAKYNMRLYNYIRQNGGFDNWTAIILEQQENIDKPSKLARENALIQQHQATLNKQSPGKHTRMGNVGYHREYNVHNRHQRQVVCVCELCGSTYSDKCHKSRHQKTKKCLLLRQNR